MFPKCWLVSPLAQYLWRTQNVSPNYFWVSSETFLVSAWRATMLPGFAADEQLRRTQCRRHNVYVRRHACVSERMLVVWAPHLSAGCRWTWASPRSTSRLGRAPRGTCCGRYRTSRARSRTSSWCCSPPGGPRSAAAPTSWRARPTLPRALRKHNHLRSDDKRQPNDHVQTRPLPVRRQTISLTITCSAQTPPLPVRRQTISLTITCSAQTPPLPVRRQTISLTITCSTQTLRIPVRRQTTSSTIMCSAQTPPLPVRRQTNDHVLCANATTSGQTTNDQLTITCSAQTQPLPGRRHTIRLQSRALRKHPHFRSDDIRSAYDHVLCANTPTSGQTTNDQLTITCSAQTPHFRSDDKRSAYDHVLCANTPTSGQTTNDPLTITCSAQTPPPAPSTTMRPQTTEFLLIGTKPQLEKVHTDTCSLTIGYSEISPSEDPIRNLGSWFDSNFTMRSHVTKTCKAAHLYNINRIRRFLSRELTESLIYAFVTSRLDYCNALLYGVPNNLIYKLQRVQNAAARLVFRAPRFCHITPLLVELHWLPVKFRIDFKIILITFKVLNGKVPKYLFELLSLLSNSSYSLRSNNKLLLSPPTIKTLPTLGDRAFAAAAFR